MSSSASIHHPTTVIKPASVSESRVWLFRALTLAAGGLMLISWFMPWWRADILELHRSVEIRPWGLEHNLGDLAGFIKGADMPSWFGPFMWAYLAICVAVLLFSLFAPTRRFQFGSFGFSLSQLLVAGVGVSYIVVLVVAAVYGSMRAGEFWDLQFIGKTYVELGEVEKGYVGTSLLLGYWLAAAAGVLLLVFGLLRSKIVGQT